MIRKRIHGVVVVYCTVVMLLGFIATFGLIASVVAGEDTVEFELAVISPAMRVPVVLSQCHAWIPGGTIAMLLGGLVAVSASHRGCPRSLMRLYRYWSLTIGLGWPGLIAFLASQDTIRITSTKFVGYGNDDLVDAILIGLGILVPVLFIDLSPNLDGPAGPAASVPNGEDESQR